MRENNLAARQEASKQSQDINPDELEDLTAEVEDVVEVEGRNYPSYDDEKEVTGVRKIGNVEKKDNSKNIEIILDLNEKIEKFNKAVESSSGRQKDILRDQLEKLLEQRKEVAIKLDDNEVVQAGLGMQRAEELKMNAKGLLQEYQTADLNETDKTVLEGKIENTTDRMKKITDSFDEEQKEKFTVGLTIEQIKNLGLERQAIRRLDRIIKSHDAIIRKGTVADKGRVIASRDKVLAEREAIWNSMSDEKVRERYGIKTDTEFMAEQGKAKRSKELTSSSSKKKKPFGAGTVFEEDI